MPWAMQGMAESRDEWDFECTFFCRESQSQKSCPAFQRCKTAALLTGFMGGEPCRRQNKYVWFSYVKSKNEKLLGLLANFIWQQILDPQNNLKTVDLLCINGSFTTTKEQKKLFFHTIILNFKHRFEIAKQNIWPFETASILMYI